jgi:diguanylate cyclase (GGDEF)-like protein
MDTNIPTPFEWGPFLACLQEPVLVIEPETHRVLACNPAAEFLFGYAPSTADPLTLEAIVPADWPAVAAAAEVASSGGERQIITCQGTSRFGEAMELSLTITAAPGNAQALALVSRPANPGADTSLSSLPSRAVFRDRLAQALSQARRHGWRVGVLCLDVDRFALINDTLGHDAGDVVLGLIADRLRGSLRDYEMVARLGTDEFLIMLTDLNDDEGLLRAVNRFQGSLLTPLKLGEQEVTVTARVGISRSGVDGEDASELIKAATVAKRFAKGQPQGYEIYRPDMAAAPARLKLVTLLKRALERNELFLHYQPQVDLKTGKIVGAEALVRWNSPDFGIVPPMQFIPVAEETGLIGPLSEWVLQEACRQAHTWRKEGLPAIRLAVNLSARNFQEADLASRVRQTLIDHNMSPELLEVEITENALMTNIEVAGGILNDLAGCGLHVSLDDFGTGYSSLSYLKRFPLHTLKIDRAFVRDIETDPHDAMIVKAIVALSHSMQLRVVAEGVENEHQLAYLVDLGCDEVQGFYFSRPLPPDEFATLLRTKGGFELPALLKHATP